MNILSRIDSGKLKKIVTWASVINLALFFLSAFSANFAYAPDFFVTNSVLSFLAQAAMVIFGFCNFAWFASVALLTIAVKKVKTKFTVWFNLAVFFLTFPYLIFVSISVLVNAVHELVFGNSAGIASELGILALSFVSPVWFLIRVMGWA